MVPQAFHDYFVASTGAGAALMGLLFVAVSIAPEHTVMNGVPIERQATAASAFTALLNAFFLSLIALLPQTNVSLAAVVLSLTGMVNHFVLAWSLFKHAKRSWLNMGRGAAFVLAGLFLYGFELYIAIQLLRAPTNSGLISALAVLLIGIYALALARAWQLLGVRNRRLGDWFSPLHSTEEEGDHKGSPLQ
jgi:hypothetical protein